MTRRKWIFWVGAILAYAGLFAVWKYRRREKPLERGQCTWYAFERARQNGWQIAFDKPWGRHARAWWEKVTNGEKGVEPRVGSAMVLDEWADNPYGHVGYVESVESPTVWYVTHANFALGEPAGKLEGVSIWRVRCERAPEGVLLTGVQRAFRLRGFLSPLPGGH